MAKAPEMRGFEEAVDQGTKMPRGEHKYEAGWCGEPERILTIDDLRLGQIPSAGVERGLEKVLRSAAVGQEVVPVFSFWRNMAGQWRV